MELFIDKRKREREKKKKKWDRHIRDWRITFVASSIKKQYDYLYRYYFCVNCTHRFGLSSTGPDRANISSPKIWIVKKTTTVSFCLRPNEKNFAQRTPYRMRGHWLATSAVDTRSPVSSFVCLFFRYFFVFHCSRFGHVRLRLGYTCCMVNLESPKSDARQKWTMLCTVDRSTMA